MFEVSLVGGNGKEWELTGSDLNSAVVAPVGALQALVGQAVYSDIEVPGRSGVIPGGARFAAISQEIEFYLNNMRGELSMQDVYNDFRRAWPAELRVETDHPLGEMVLPVEARAMPGTSVDPSKVDAIRLPVTVFNKDGLFHTLPQYGTNTVTVTNMGVEMVYPLITYSGAGGQVVTPSGARFTLPAAASSTVVDLHPRKLRLPGAFPEGIPPGESGTWSLPAGATLSWYLWIADPWA